MALLSNYYCHADPSNNFFLWRIFPHLTLKKTTKMSKKVKLDKQLCLIIYATNLSVPYGNRIQLQSYA